jgi:hypothetical protein
LRSITDPESAKNYAELLALLADDFGAETTVSLGRPQSRSEAAVVAQLVASLPEDWPASNASGLEAGIWAVTTTVLSQNARSFNQEWIAQAYSFEFDSSGRLLAWAKRRANPNPR